LDLADIGDAVAVEQRLDRLAEIGAVVLADLGRELYFQAGAPGDLDGAVGALVARKTAEKDQIGVLRVGLVIWPIEIDRQTVMGRRQPVGVGQAAPLAV